MAKTVEVESAQNIEKLVTDLQLKTPIDTGYARSRWSIDTVPNSGMSFRVKYSPYVFNFLSKDFVISNDADYIKYLNRGSSQQAPSFFIEQTILNHSFKVNNIIFNSP
jgi:hypothetical protein